MQDLSPTMCAKGIFLAIALAASADSLGAPARLASPSNSAVAPTIISFITLPALQVTTPIPGSKYTPGDFNGDGISDILWFNPSPSRVGYWTMSASVPGNYGGSVSHVGTKIYDVTSGYFVGAAGDFNGDGYADLVFTSASRDLWMWTNDQHGGWVSTKLANTPYPGQWQLIGAGDIDGDGHDDLLWLDPTDCKFGYWTMNGTTITGYHTVDVTCGYYPISLGYYTHSNRLSIAWTSAANDLYIWDSVGNTSGGNLHNGFNSYNILPPANIQIMSMGGGYEGQNIGLQIFHPNSSGQFWYGQGLTITRYFNSAGEQTSAPVSPTSAPVLNSEGIGGAGYLIAGNGVNDTGVYNSNAQTNFIGTGGLFNYTNPLYSGSAAIYPMLENACTSSNCWFYAPGWSIVGGLANGAAAPPWQ